MSGDATAAQVREFLTDPGRIPSCLLCGGGPTTVAGLVFPKDSRRYGAAGGDVRVFRYSLCEDCRARGEAAAREADDLLSASVRAATARPEDN